MTALELEALRLVALYGHADRLYDREGAAPETACREGDDTLRELAIAGLIAIDRDDEGEAEAMRLTLAGLGALARAAREAREASEGALAEPDREAARAVLGRAPTDAEVRAALDAFDRAFLAHGPGAEEEVCQAAGWLAFAYALLPDDARDAIDAEHLEARERGDAARHPDPEVAASYERLGGLLAAAPGGGGESGG
ncbi:MAG TPA: hypothetical protein VFS43_21765 [Polyangiaceae bacterium]|nr:hypothetical protein [Polyangiaceae bacterium]